MRSRQQGLRARRFHDLMPHRVREVLLVSSPYDAFILEEDGLLTEQLFLEYLDIGSPSSPRFTHVPSGAAALRELKRRRYDLILAMTSMADMNVNAFGKKVKRLRPGKPVVLLALDRGELHELWKTIDPEAFDGAFLWSGDAKILLAIIKFVEDRENVEHDVELADVRVIIMLEDSPRYYSSFLGMLYKELMIQSRSLYSEGINELHRHMYIKSRPKVLHATSYEKGLELVERYRHNLLAVITDIGIPRGGEIDKSAGLDLARTVRSHDPELPVLIQSAEARGAQCAAQTGAVFLDKNSPTLLAELRSFLRDHLGFGDFVFRTPDGGEIDRARDIRELEQKLAAVPPESIVYHASHNHFSIWLVARSEFELAEKLRPRQVSEFPSVEEIREYLIQNLRDVHISSHRGVVADFSRRQFAHDPFCRLGRGSLGGKARGLAFFFRNLARTPPGTFRDLPVKLPKTVVLTTEHFDGFIAANDLWDFASSCTDDGEIARRFLAVPLPDELTADLEFLVERMAGPLAVRSSSLLEDSMHQVVAGIYATLMLPNDQRDPEARLRDLCDAVKLVYASVFYRNSRAYLDNSGHLLEEEKMAVIVQRLVGQEHDTRFYPTFSGVAQSHNHYPIGPQKPEEGIVHLALGLGRTIVEGGLALRVSPVHPEVLPQFATPEAVVKGSQTTFFALDLSPEGRGSGTGLADAVKRFHLDAAESDGTLLPVGSVYSAEDRVIRDDLATTGPRVITFNNIVKHRAIPLAETIVELMRIAQRGLARAVELEFACDMGDWGSSVPRGRKPKRPELFVLQARPLGPRSRVSERTRIRFDRESSLCVTRRSLGYGVHGDLRDLIYVRRDRWQAEHNKAIAGEVGELNEALKGNRRHYLLIGPGRWGTADPWLGIPVQWSQISNVRVIVEASPAGYDVEPSQGTHFFQNMTSLGIGYLTLPPGAEKRGERPEYLDWEWLDRQAAATQTRFLRHLRFDEPLTVVLDGARGRGTIAVPGAQPL